MSVPSSFEPLFDDRSQRGPRMSFGEWATLPEDEPGELVDGFLEEEEVSDSMHELAVSWLVGLLRAWLKDRGGFVLTSEVKLAIRPDRGRKPDLSVFLPGGSVPPRRGPLRVPPDVAIEVVSPSPRDERRDRVEKMEDYASFKVRYYWLLDPTLAALEIFELGADGRYVRALAATAGVIDTVPGCAGLRIDLSDLWADLRRLGPDETR